MNIVMVNALPIRKNSKMIINPDFSVIDTELKMENETEEEFLLKVYKTLFYMKDLVRASENFKTFVEDFNEDNKK